MGKPLCQAQDLAEHVGADIVGGSPTTLFCLMLDRNKRIKRGPEKFQSCKALFDLILTCEETVYELVAEDLNSREQETRQPVHVINVDVQDNCRSP